MGAVADRQRTATRARVRGKAERLVCAGRDIGEIERVAGAKAGNRAGERPGLIEPQAARRAHVEGDRGIGRAAEFDAARTPDLGGAAASDRAIDDEPARAARLQRPRVDDRIRPGVNDQRAVAGRIDNAFVSQGELYVPELGGATDALIDVVE